MHSAQNLLELPGPDAMASCVLRYLAAGKLAKATSLACAAAQVSGGPAFFEANALAAIACAKAEKTAAALEYWDKIVRSAPQKLKWTEKALAFAWQVATPDSAKFAAKWQDLLARVYIALPSFAILQQMMQKGWQGCGSVGVHGGSLRGWMWLKNDERPKLLAELPKGAKFQLNLIPRFKGETHTLHEVNENLSNANIAYRLNITNAAGLHAQGSPVIVSPPAVAQIKTSKKKESASITVIIPVYDDAKATLACIGSVLASLKYNKIKPAVLVAWDNGPDASLLKKLRNLASKGRIILLENQANMGFLASVNNAIAKIHAGDVILLNADTLVHGNWLDRLAKAGEKEDAATVTALGNEAELMSYPSAFDRGKIEKLSQVAVLDKAAASLDSEDALCEIPVGVGFCMLITRRAIIRIGGLDGRQIFRGYGEEVDYSLRAEKAGLKNYGLHNLFVGHLGERSFGLSKKALAAQNNEAIFEQFKKYRRGYERYLLYEKPKKLKEKISLAALSSLKSPEAMELRPWSMRYLPPWLKDDVCKPEKDGLALFLQTGPRPRALLRIWTKTPIAEMLFDLPGDEALLKQALLNLNIKKVINYLPTSASPWLSRLALEDKLAAPAEDIKLPPFTAEKYRHVLASPPTNMAAWKKLLNLARQLPEITFHVFFIDSLWAGALKPANIEETPLMDDYTPLSPDAFLTFGPKADNSAWRRWLDCHSCKDIPMFQAGNQ